jgi:hypothetical protein
VKDKYQDEGVLPRSGGKAVDKDGIDDQGYLNKKGAPAGQKVTREGISAGSMILNQLPPGSNIADQQLADINEQPFRQYQGGTSYPGDGGFPDEPRSKAKR